MGYDLPMPSTIAIVCECGQRLAVVTQQRVGAVEVTTTKVVKLSKTRLGSRWLAAAGAVADATGGRRQPAKYGPGRSRRPGEHEGSSFDFHCDRPHGRHREPRHYRQRRDKLAAAVEQRLASGGSTLVLGVDVPA